MAVDASPAVNRGDRSDGFEPYREIVRILLDAGADPSVADGEGGTAFEHVERRGQEQIARILRRADQ